jgi:hypothetical protein
VLMQQSVRLLRTLPGVQTSHALAASPIHVHAIHVHACALAVVHADSSAAKRQAAEEAAKARKNKERLQAMFSKAAGTAGPAGTQHVAPERFHHACPPLQRRHSVPARIWLTMLSCAAAVGLVYIASAAQHRLVVAARACSPASFSGARLRQQTTATSHYHSWQMPLSLCPAFPSSPSLSKAQANAQVAVFSFSTLLCHDRVALDSCALFTCLQ